MRTDYSTLVGAAQAELRSRVIGDLAIAHEFVPLVNGSNLTDCPAARAHYEAVSSGTRTGVLNALQ